MITAGLDIGSCTIELVVLDEDRPIFTRRSETSFDYPEQVRALLSETEYDRILVTGYGRHLVAREFGMGHVTEIKAHAAGVHHLVPEARTILDIGGQDTKVISLDKQGKVTAFEMNDRCSAGTGRFFEVMAQALACRIGELGDLALSGADRLRISSMCTVFAETEVVALRARGEAPEDVAHAVVVSVVYRVSSMIRRVGLREKAVFCGGVARNKAVVQILAQELGCGLFVPEAPDFTGAMGAAILARGS